MRGSPGKATEVATSTTGLIAGADNMNVNAAAPDAPSNNRRAIGTEPHSHPGSAAPPTPATRIAAPPRRGSQRASRSGVTNAATKPLTTTPSTRNGSACTNTPQNTVAATDSFARPAMNALTIPPVTANATRTTRRSSIDPMRTRRVRKPQSPQHCAAASW